VICSQSVDAKEPSAKAVQIVGDLESASNATSSPKTKTDASMLQLLRFTGPALGIYLLDPIMTNIDNGFVGRFSGTTALASLGPGNTISTNILFVFASVFNTATTGLLSRALGKDDGAKAARSELSQLLSIVLIAGPLLMTFLLVCGEQAMLKIGVPPDLVRMALPYSHIRALAATPVLIQGICLSALLTAKDAVTPLKVVAIAAALNFILDATLCGWPFQFGIVGAAWATTLSQVVGCFFMLGALRRKGLAPSPARITARVAKVVVEYAGPGFINTGSRVLGYVVMSTVASRLGYIPGAAYQVAMGVFTVFAFVSAPLNQIAQTLMPPVIDSGSGEEVRRVAKNLLKFSFGTAAITACLCTAVLTFGSTLLTTDPAVLAEVGCMVPAIFLSTALICLHGAMDGALVAAKDFGFIMPGQAMVCCVQVAVLMFSQKMNWSLAAIVASFPLRMGLFLVAAAVRLRCGFGPLGRALQRAAA